MRLLLDTHMFLWLNSDPDKLSSRALAACRDPDNDLFLSVVSAWEIQIKVQLGKLRLATSLANMLLQWQATKGLGILSVRLEHVLVLDSLPLHHKDPFDRLLISQARVEGLHFISADTCVQMYQVPIFW